MAAFVANNIYATYGYGHKVSLFRIKRRLFELELNGKHYAFIDGSKKRATLEYKNLLKSIEP